MQNKSYTLSAWSLWTLGILSLILIRLRFVVSWSIASAGPYGSLTSLWSSQNGGVIYGVKKISRDLQEERSYNKSAQTSSGIAPFGAQMASQPIYILCTPEPTPTNVSSLILVNMSVSILDSEAWLQNKLNEMRLTTMLRSFAFPVTSRGRY